MADDSDEDGVVRCESRIFGIFKTGGPYAGLFEVKCQSKRCKNGDPSTVVFHYFDLSSGVLKATNRYREPEALFLSERQR